MPNGTRRAHTRRTKRGGAKPVRSASIKNRQAPKKRLNAAAKRKAQRKPLLAAAGTLAGLGALDAILSGRWGVALVLFSFAGGFLVAHAARQHHLKRKAARQSPAEQRRRALKKARDQQERTAMAAERKRAWSKEGLKEFWRGEDPPPSGTRPAPAKASVEPEGPRPDPPKRAVQQTDGTTANLHTPRRAATKRPAAWWPKQPREGTKAAVRFHALRAKGYQGAIDEDGWAMTDIEVAREQAKRRGEPIREGAK